MVRARDGRRHLKSLLSNAEIVIGGHHATYALDNVTRARVVEELTTALNAKVSSIARLKQDLDLAKAEQQRLAKMNAELLEVLKDREQDEQGLKAKHAAILVAQRRSAALHDGIVNDAVAVEKLKRRELGRIDQLMARVGENHSEVMRQENDVLQLKLTTDTERARCFLPRLRQDCPTPLVAMWRGCEMHDCIHVAIELQRVEDALFKASSYPVSL